jgi:hypothetical protein
MRPSILNLLLAACFMNGLQAQNSLSLQLEDGAPFRVLLNDKVYNTNPQSQVLLTDIKKDTLFVKVELEKGERYGLTLFLLDKGKSTRNKEFTYLLRKERNRLRPVFMGMYEAGKLRGQ